MSTSTEDFRICAGSFSEISAVSVELEGDNVAVAAYEDSRIPSIIITERNLSRSAEERQEMNFKRICFKGFEGYRVWCCEVEGNEMKVCLVR